MGAALMCALLLLPSLRIIPSGAQAQSAADTGRVQEIDNRIETFFGALMRGSSGSAFEDLLQGSSLGAPSAAPQVVALRTKVDELKLFGAILHWERYDTRSIGTDVSVVRYILKYDQHPVIWTFVFYRKPSGTSSITSANNPWVVLELRFDTSFL